MPDLSASDAALHRVLTAIQVRGGIGPQPIADAIVHSDRFVAACPQDAARGVDLGSGGGLPGLVLAIRRPALELHLIERRATRADLLRYGVSALALGERVTVHSVDVGDVAQLGLGAVDLVTARSFAPLAVTLRTAAEILGPSGCILVSAPPEGVTLQDDGLLAELGLTRDDAPGGIFRCRRS